MRPINVIEKLNEEEKVDNKGIESLRNSIETILHNCNAEISYVESYSPDDRHNYYEIQISCRFRPDSLSKYDNDVKLYGNLYFDENLKIAQSDISTSSGPNVLNYDFIRALRALYTYFDSGNQHYDM